MPRVKRAVIANKRRKNVLKDTKGFKWGRKSKLQQAKQALQKAGSYGYRDRKAKKRTMRGLQQTQIGIACKANGTSYSKFIAALKKNKIELDRKVLSQIAREYPKIFEEILKKSGA